MIKRKIIISFCTAFLSVFSLPGIALAHVAVSPAQATAASELVFSVSVPNEKDSAVTGVRLVIPNDVKDATPTVKPGWTITTKKTADQTSEISWTGGEIPAGQRDDFSFSAQAPAKGELHWKAYQTYADGSTASWDRAASGNSSDEDAAGNGAYSVTKIVDDLANPNQSTISTATNNSKQVVGAYALAAAALAIAVIALRTQRKSR